MTPQQLKQRRSAIIAVNSGAPNWASHDWLVGECLQLLGELEEVTAKLTTRIEPDRRLGAEKAIEDIVGVIWDIQWHQPQQNGQPSCPSCDAFQQDGHALDCPIATILEAHSGK